MKGLLKEISCILYFYNKKVIENIKKLMSCDYFSKKRQYLNTKEGRKWLSIKCQNLLRG